MIWQETSTTQCMDGADGWMDGWFGCLISEALAEPEAEKDAQKRANGPRYLSVLRRWRTKVQVKLDPGHSRWMEGGRKKMDCGSGTPVGQKWEGRARVQTREESLMYCDGKAPTSANTQGSGVAVDFQCGLAERGKRFSCRTAQAGTDQTDRF